MAEKEGVRGGAPSPLPGLGTAIMGGLGCLTPYRPYFMVFTLAALAVTFLRHFQGRMPKERGGGVSAMLAALLPSGEKDVLLYLGAALVFALMIVPPWSVTQYFYRAKPAVSAVRSIPLKLIAAKNPPLAINPCLAPNPCSGK